VWAKQEFKVEGAVRVLPSLDLSELLMKEIYPILTMHPRNIIFSTKCYSRGYVKVIVVSTLKIQDPKMVRVDLSLSSTSDSQGGLR
jgi:hypothetical protein